MKRSSCKTLGLAAWLFPILLTMALTATAQVYKTTDKDGNVIFTDKAPSATAEPMDLPGLSVISPAEPIEEPQTTVQDSEEDTGETVTNIRELRRGYRDFTMQAPEPEETFWGADSRIVATWTVGHRLQPGMQVTFIVNGESRLPTTAESVVLTGLERGTHAVYAELRDERQRLVARADSVTFFVKQFSSNFNRPESSQTTRAGG
jgi:hypothetical protein